MDIQDLLKRLNKEDYKRPCPNCGEFYFDYQLRYSSVHKIVVASGTLCSTLYGVCKHCADIHNNQESYINQSVK